MTIERGELDAAATMELVQAQLNHNTLLMNRARERIRMLEAHNTTLEAALREIKDQYLAPEESSAIASAALATEHDKCVHSWSAPFDGVVKCKKCGAILTEE